MKKKLRLIICSLFILLVAAVGCVGHPGNTKQEKIAYVMEQAYNNHEFIGNVLVVDSGKIIYKECFGYADAASNIKNSDSTRFLLASISKPITAVVILRLAEKGLLQLEDSMGRFFSIKNPSVGRITIHQLLTHSSGIPEIINEKNAYDLTASLNKAKLKFQPGSSFEYSNAGFVLLAKIAEEVTGDKFESIVQKEVFGPAGMPYSGVARNDAIAKLAKGYYDVLQKDTTTYDYRFENMDGSGSLYATIGDLYRFHNALRDTQLLTVQSQSLMYTPHIAGKYAYGWYIGQRRGMPEEFWCKGFLPGFRTYMSHSKQKQQLIIVLSNAENVSITDIKEDIASILNQ